MSLNHRKYFKEAALVASRALCNRARCGAVVVSKEGRVIGKGYNAPPLEDELQRQCNQVFDITIKPKSDKTCCVHAEWNAILDAVRNYPEQMQGSFLYFMRVDNEGAFTDAGSPYCTACSRLALQSGVKMFGLWNARPQMIDTKKYNLVSYNFYA
jgi:deoxycytidylate deaminase